MATPLNNSPVKFAADINIAGCFPKGQRYFQLVQYGDDLMFQLPRLCLDIEEAFVGSLFQPNGAVWTIDGDTFTTTLEGEVFESDIIVGEPMNSNPCEVGRALQVCVNISGLGAGVYAEIWAVDETNTLTTLLVTKTTSGLECFTITAGSFTTLAILVIGESGMAATSIVISEFYLRCAPCLTEICILDDNDDVVVTLSPEAILELTNHLQVEFNWSDQFYEASPGIFTALPEGCYRLSICTGDYEGILTSQWYNLRATHECTLLLSWTNTNDAYGFDYSAGLTHYLRVYGRMRNPKYQGEKEIFADSAGNRYVLNATKIKKHELVISEQPEYIHDALSIGVDHDHFYIDGEEYFVEEPEYTPQWRGTSALSPVIIEVGESQQNLSNRLC